MDRTRSSVKPLRGSFGPLGDSWECIVEAQEQLERAQDALRRAGDPPRLMAWAQLAEDVLAKLRGLVERERTRGGEVVQ